MPIDIRGGQIGLSDHTPMLATEASTRSVRENYAHRERLVIVGCAALCAVGGLLLGIGSSGPDGFSSGHALLGVSWITALVLGALAFSTKTIVQPWKGEAAVAASLAILSMMVWEGNEVRDIAILAMPLLFVLAGIVCREGFFRVVASLAVLHCGMLAGLEAAGFFTEPAHPLSWGRAGYVVVLLAAQAIATAALTRNVRYHLLAAERAQKAAESALARADQVANTDPVTGLPNRRVALAYGQAACQRVLETQQSQGGHGEQVGVILIEVSDFPVIAESVGELAASEYLKALAGRVKRFAEMQFVAHVGASDFALVATGSRGADQLGVSAAALLDAVCKPVLVEGIEVHPSAAAGIARFPEDGDQFHVVMANALRACVDAQMQGTRSYRYFDEAMDRRTAAQLRLVAELRSALERGGEGLWIAYQPQVEIVTGRIIGVEALLRWEHPRLGLLPTPEVIDLAESSGLVIPLGEWVLNRACREAVNWTAPALQHVPLSVNVSPAQFEIGDVVKTVREALIKSGLQSDRLILEFTEGLMLGESPALHESLGDLSKLGVRFAVDDFGTGYSNIGYLQRFDIHTLKLDRSFVLATESSDRSRVLAKAVVALGNALDMQVVAEGVETRALAARVVQMGCVAGQGYLWAKPLPNGEFDAAIAGRPSFTPILELGRPFPL